MKRSEEGTLRKVARQIRREAMRQIGGFPKDELRKQLVGGWGEEFARQLFGNPRNRGRGRQGSL